MIVFIDNYDSFTYNLVQIFQGMGEEVKVFRNDKTDLFKIAKLTPRAIVVSPGPGNPKESGISVEVIRYSGRQRIPLLGVCLGHQAIAVAFGGRVSRAKRIMHGKTSYIYHDEKFIYKDISNPFKATRYHSLLVERNSLPDCLEVTSWTKEGEIMGIRHKYYPIEGVQFHPESILTEEGERLLYHFLNGRKAK